MVHQNDPVNENKNREQLVRELAQANARIIEIAREIDDLKDRNGKDKCAGATASPAEQIHFNLTRSES